MKPKTIRYKSYKKLDNYAFRVILLNKLLWRGSNMKLEDIVISTLNYINQRIPFKNRYVRANQVPYMNKTISNTIMVRSRLKNVSVENKRNYTRQRNFKEKKRKTFLLNLIQKTLLTAKSLGKL